VSSFFDDQNIQERSALPDTVSIINWKEGLKLAGAAEKSDRPIVLLLFLLTRKHRRVNLHRRENNQTGIPVTSTGRTKISNSLPQ
jgi:hypothetical protein